MNKDRLIILQSLEKKLHYKFKNIEILDAAFHHISVINEQNKYYESNERMEFLGDAIVGLVFTEYIYYKFKNKNEGELTKIKSSFVCEESFAYMANFFDLGEYLILGKGEEKSGGRNRNSILADTFEAVLAAIYIDSNSYSKVYGLVTERYIDIFKQFIDLKLNTYNYKEILQNYIQINYQNEVVYRLDKTEGPDHEKIFYITATYGSISLEQGIGKNKKNAEQNAAKKSIKKLGIKYE